MSASPKTGRAGVWFNIRRMGDKEFRAFDVDAGVEITRGGTGHYLRKLFEAGILERRLPGRAKTGYLYKMRCDPGAIAPKVGRDESKPERGEKLALVWRTMRRMKCFTSDELASVSSAHTDEIEISVALCQNYLSSLAKAGYVRGKRAPGGNHKIYEMVRNTGPLPPILSYSVYDRNTGATVWTEAEGVIA